mmetsp:Transcript_21392/g.52549  ORF Transcript_21392/g.52549 Transcript_21392/m.52549 type:complete len:273 (-) Transcript_21392:2726-3544(-)
MGLHLLDVENLLEALAQLRTEEARRLLRELHDLVVVWVIVHLSEAAPAHRDDQPGGKARVVMRDRERLEALEVLGLAIFDGGGEERARLDDALLKILAKPGVHHVEDAALHVREELLRDLRRHLLRILAENLGAGLVAGGVHDRRHTLQEHDPDDAHELLWQRRQLLREKVVEREDLVLVQLVERRDDQHRERLQLRQILLRQSRTLRILQLRHRRLDGVLERLDNDLLHRPLRRRNHVVLEFAQRLLKRVHRLFGDFWHDEVLEVCQLDPV